MRRWSDSTFIFISTNPRHDDGGVEDRWFAVMEELRRRGASVRFMCLMRSPAAERARARGIDVDPYILDKWNVIRSHTRLRKYLKRYVPVAVHSTGLEADLISRWAARKVPQTRAVVTLDGDPQGTRRRSPIDRLMRRYDELGMRSLAAVFCESPELADEVRSAGVDPARVVLDPAGSSAQESVARHVAVYAKLLRERGAG